jgi:hypothetical protein
MLLFKSDSTNLENALKQIVLVNPDLGIEVLNVEDFEFDKMEEVTVGTQNYPRTLRAFTEMQAELLALKDGTGNAADFIQRHGAWLANLSRTGFAVEYTQFVKK